MPSFSLHVVWDSGAEGSGISPRACSGLMRLQYELPDEKKPLTDLTRLEVLQRFAGCYEDDEGKSVSVQGLLTIQIKGVSLLALDVRIIPFQYDDVLIAAPELDVLGFTATPTAFHLSSVGVSIPRTEQPRNNSQRE